MNQDRFLTSSLSHGIPKIDNPLSISWHDSSWIPMLNTGNIMDYFSERTNPFYDRTCNNENLKMQRLGPEHLGNMIGLEYCLLHVQEPILYVIRKQHRHSPSQVTPIADYYILAGVVYQAPDLASVIGSRLLTTVHHMQAAFDEASSYSQYHPSKGYWWEFKENEKTTEKVKTKEEPGSAFQRRRVDVLLAELAKKFPPKIPSPPQLEKQTTEEAAVKAETKDVKEIKTEKAEATTTTATTTSVTSSSTATAPVNTPTTTAVLLPPPPPPPAPTSAITTTSTTSAAAPRAAMKPPPEKRPRLV